MKKKEKKEKEKGTSLGFLLKIFFPFTRSSSSSMNCETGRAPPGPYWSVFCDAYEVKRGEEGSGLIVKKKKRKKRKGKSKTQTANGVFSSVRDRRRGIQHDKKVPMAGEWLKKKKKKKRTKEQKRQGRRWG